MNAQATSLPVPTDIETALKVSAKDLWKKQNAIEKISTPEEAASAADLLKLLDTHVKKIDKERKAFVQPLNDHVKMINNQFYGVAAPLEAAIAALKSKILSYNQGVQKKIEAERKEREAKEAEERRNIEEAEAAARAQKLPPGAQADLLTTPPAPPAPIAEPVVKTDPITTQAPPLQAGSVRGNYGQAVIKKSWEYKVKDIAAFAKAYPHLVEVRHGDVKRMIAAMDGKPIDGLEIYQTETVATR